MFLARHPELADDYQQWMGRLGIASADDKVTRVSNQSLSCQLNTQLI